MVGYQVAAAPDKYATKYKIYNTFKEKKENQSNNKKLIRKIFLNAIIKNIIFIQFLKYFNCNLVKNDIIKRYK